VAGFYSARSEIIPPLRGLILHRRSHKGLQANVSVDWAHRDSARARLRVLVKRILREYGYPPDLEDAAVQGVLAQAEALLSEITVA
jgi:hypothetical protein